MLRYASNVDPSAGQVNEEENVESDKSTGGQYLGGEEIRSDNGVCMALMKSAQVVLRLRMGAGGLAFRRRMLPTVSSLIS